MTSYIASILFVHFSNLFHFVVNRCQWCCLLFVVGFDMHMVMILIYTIFWYDTDIDTSNIDWLWKENLFNSSSLPMSWNDTCLLVVMNEIACLEPSSSLLLIKKIGTPAPTHSAIFTQISHSDIHKFSCTNIKMHSILVCLSDWKWSSESRSHCFYSQRHMAICMNNFL